MPVTVGSIRITLDAVKLSLIQGDFSVSVSVHFNVYVTGSPFHRTRARSKAKGTYVLGGEPLAPDDGVDGMAPSPDHILLEQ